MLLTAMVIADAIGTVATLLVGSSVVPTF